MDENEAQKEAQKEWTPDPIDGGLSKHVRRHFWCLLDASVMLAIIWLVFLGLLPYMDPSNAAIKQMRYITAKTMATFTGVDILLWITWFVEWIVNGNIFGAMIRDGKAGAIYLSALLLCASGIFIYV